MPGTRGMEKCLLNELKKKTMERNSTDDYKLQLDTKFPVVEYLFVELDLFRITGRAFPFN